MEHKLSRQLNLVSRITLLLGVAMVIYWGLYVSGGMPLAGVPVLPEIVNAGLAMASGAGLLRRQKWAVPAALATTGMWAYGVLGGIQLVIENGLDFSSPFGAITDALLFPLILVFSVYMAVVVWRARGIIR